jgi:hypothetical protein
VEVDDNFENKCFVELDCKYCRRMHDYLGGLGRDLAGKEHPEVILGFGDQRRTFS